MKCKIYNNFIHDRSLDLSKIWQKAYQVCPFSYILFDKFVLQSNAHTLFQVLLKKPTVSTQFKQARLYDRTANK